jgi:predicted nucleotidyltransferase
MLDGFSHDAVSEVRKRLDEVRASGVRILFAIESGSRAWGFPSPDSDYDCRFVYLRSMNDHLALHPHRDVIEFPIAGEIDAGGWDLRKALLLSLKGNAVIVEWVKSPEVYEEIASFRHRFAAVLDQIVDPRLVARHYLGLLENHMQTGTDSEIKLKTLFYALRPAFALRYLEQHQFTVLPPMNMRRVMIDIAVPSQLADVVTAMIEEKSVTREMGTGQTPRAIADYLVATHRHFRSLLPTLEISDFEQRREQLAIAERFYIDTVRELAT